jgi:hypothetical protein
MIVNWSQCGRSELNETGLSCVWLEEEDTKCETVKKSCDDIEKKRICETIGAVADDDNKVLECLWIEGNSSS